MTSSRMILAGFALFLGLPAGAFGQALQWHHDYNAARSIARERNRPMLLDFGTPNCFWCKQLDATTFRDPGIVRVLSEKFVLVKIDAVRTPALAQAMEVNAYPTLIFLSPEGKVVSRQDGYVDVARMQGLLTKVLASSNAFAAHALPSPPVSSPPVVPMAPKPSVAPEPRFVVPSPAELGVATTLPTVAMPESAPREDAADAGALFARLRQIGALAFRLERLEMGFRASIELPGENGAPRAVEGVGTSEATALARAIANVRR